MNIDIELFAKLLAPVITTIIAVIAKHYSEGRARVVSFIGHISSFKLKGENPTDVYTHSVVVRNTGRKTAQNVRLGHHFLPDNLTVFPSVQYSIEYNPEGKAEIVLPRLVPKEQITISYLYFPPVTWNQIHAYTKSDEGYAEIINVIPTAQPSILVKLIVWSLMFIGTSFIVYWSVKLAAHLLE
jgi:hypothetical protein